MKRTLVAAALLAAALAPAPAAAKSWPEPKVAYSADSFTRSGDLTMESKVFRAPGKERRELTTGGQTQIMILRLDKKTAYTLMPEAKLYIETSLADAQAESGDIAGSEVSQTVVGEETLDGVKTTKSKIAVRQAGGGRFEGFVWSTKDGIVMRLEGGEPRGGASGQIITWLENLKIGPQDDSLFEIPPGYNKMSLPMPFGGAPGGERFGATDGLALANPPMPCV
jgi:hypothetical protein